MGSKAPTQLLEEMEKRQEKEERKSPAAVAPKKPRTPPSGRRTVVEDIDEKNDDDEDERSTAVGEDANEVEEESDEDFFEDSVGARPRNLGGSSAESGSTEGGKKRSQEINASAAVWRARPTRPTGLRPEERSGRTCAMKR